MKSLESIKSITEAGKEPENKQENFHSEAEAEALLDELLTDPENSFLLNIPKNKDVIDNAKTAREALLFAKEKVARRIEETMEVRVVSEIEGVEIHGLNYEGLKKNVDSIIRNAVEIGRGGDGFVVIDKSEIRNLPPEICYKFAIDETKPRGRNSTAAEFEMQERFYTAANELQESRIGVPIPFYSIEIGERKMIAMEKLNAVSIDEILRGKGSIPAWFDVYAFCTELEKLLTHLHNNGLYHRDMHLGNLMISQTETLNESDKMGYIIDFGLSGRDSSGLEPYRKEEAGDVFTYEDDRGIVEKVKRELLRRKRV